MSELASVKVTSHAKEVRAEVEKSAAVALEACGLLAENYAKQNVTAGVPRNAKSWYTPTGALRNSITHTVKGDDVYIGSNLPYAVYNELGTGIYYPTGRKSPWWYVGSDGKKHKTSGMTALHFLKNAVANHIEQYKDLIKRYLKS